MFIKYWSEWLAAVNLAGVLLWCLSDSSTVSIYGLIAIFLAFISLPLSLKQKLTVADAVTISRLLIVFVVCYLYLSDGMLTFFRQFFIILALILDGVDGYLARLHDPTKYGAILDEEADGVITVLLSMVAVQIVGLPLWVYVIAAWRPLYVLAHYWQVIEVKSSSSNPWFGKTICVVTIGALIFNLSPSISLGIKTVISIFAALLISLSFVRSISRWKLPFIR